MRYVSFVAWIKEICCVSSQSKRNREVGRKDLHPISIYLHSFHPTVEFTRKIQSDSVRFSYIFSPLDTSCHFVSDSVRFLEQQYQPKRKRTNGKTTGKRPKKVETFFNLKCIKDMLLTSGAKVQFSCIPGKK